MTQEEKAQLFEAIHLNTFILPNAWDVASARIFEEEKFPAVGTTSGGIAFSLGYPDGQRIPAGEMLSVVKRIAQALEAPVSADIEAGYGDPIATAQRAWEAGAVGINLEDVTGDDASTEVPLDQQAEVIRRIRVAAPQLVVNARTDIFLIGIGEAGSRLERAIERLRIYQEAGAQSVFAPGLKDSRQIAELAAAVNAPLNILGGPGFPDLQALKKLGVKRVSVGSGPMRACMGLVAKIARELQNGGTYQAITEGQFVYAEANRLFGRKSS